MVDKESLLEDIRGAATIPLDSQISPVTDLSDDNFSGNLVEQLSSISERILEEVKETNRLVYELFTSDASKIKEDDSEKQAIKDKKEDYSANILSGLLSQLDLVFKDLKDFLGTIKTEPGATSQGNNDSKEGGSGGIIETIKDVASIAKGGGGAVAGGAAAGGGGIGALGKGGLQKLIQGAKTAGKGAVRLAPGASIVAGGTMGLKDLYDMVSGENGGLNGENIGGAIGTVIGGGLGALGGALLTGGTAGGGSVAVPTLIGGGATLGNMIGEYIGGLIDGSGNDTPKDTKQYGLPSESNLFTQRLGSMQSTREPKVADVGSSTTQSPKSIQTPASSATEVMPAKPSFANPTKVSKASIDSGTMSSATMIDTSSGGLSEVSDTMSVDNSTVTDLKMLAMPDSTTAKKVAVVTNDSMQEDQFEILPPITMGEQGPQQSIPNVTDSVAMASLELGQVPNPNYLGSAVSILAEMYA